MRLMIVIFKNNQVRAAVIYMVHKLRIGAYQRIVNFSEHTFSYNCQSKKHKMYLRFKPDSSLVKDSKQQINIKTIL